MDKPFHRSTVSSELGVLTPSLLHDHFVSGFKPESDLKVGVEWEKIGIYADSGEAICYSGDRGVEAILTSLATRYSWKPLFSHGRIIALRKNDTSITLEPGGQIELSGWKAAAIAENARELYSHLAEIREVSEPLGIAWLGIGAQPFSVAEDIEWVPKQRYAIMRESLKGRGPLTFSMMKETASVQISVDYTSESDASEKLRLALGLSPFLTAMFANSPLHKGRDSGFRSRRAAIWTGTDPARTGVIWKALREDFSFNDYIEYALGVPMLFVVRDEEWLAVRGLTFAEFMKNGYEGLQATLADWELHLTSIFTESRLKKYVEIRSIDCQTTALGLAAVAFLKGIFYDAAARRKALGFISSFDEEDLRGLATEAPKRALEARCKKGDMLDFARELLRLSEAGLGRLGEGDYLTPLKALLADGESPSCRLLRELGGETDRPKAAAKIIQACRIA